MLPNMPRSCLMVVAFTTSVSNTIPELWSNILSLMDGLSLNAASRLTTSARASPTAPRSPLHIITVALRQFRP